MQYWKIRHISLSDSCLVPIYLFVEREKIGAMPSQSIFVSNFLSPYKQIKNDWVRICFSRIGNESQYNLLFVSPRTSTQTVNDKSNNNKSSMVFKR